MLIYQQHKGREVEAGNLITEMRMLKKRKQQAKGRFLKSLHLNGQEESKELTNSYRINNHVETMR